jgi:hypothetical protein
MREVHIFNKPGPSYICGSNARQASRLSFFLTASVWRLGVKRWLTGGHLEGHTRVIHMAMISTHRAGSLIFHLGGIIVIQQRINVLACLI